MWPWGHLAVAYLLYTGYHWRRDRRPPRARPVIALAIGSQFPDLIDKPSAWTFGFLPGGRTLAHSIFVAALLLPAAYGLSRRLGRPETGVAFAIGHASHLVADVPPTAILARDLSATTFLFWPVLEPPQYQSPGSILAGFLGYSMGWYEWVQLGLVAVALVAWYHDGAPGLGYGRRALERVTGNRGLSEPKR
ncbi:metal-dependent hydrolase [Natrinema mahii]|nr:metal-dependent hydrolase [Natrinema mahii]